MTTIRDRRGWLAKLRGLLSRGPATTEEQMARLKVELDDLLERDVQQRFRHSEGAAISDAGMAAFSIPMPTKEQARLDDLLRGGPAEASTDARRQFDAPPGAKTKATARGHKNG